MAQPPPPRRSQRASRWLRPRRIQRFALSTAKTSPKKFRRWAPFSVDVVGTFAIATNTVPYEQRRLEGKWEIHFCADVTSTILVRVDSVPDREEIMEREECLKHSVFRKAGTGELSLVDDGCTTRRQHSVDVEASRRSNAVATITTGVSSPTADLAMTMFRRPRKGAQMCFWSLSSVRKFLALDTYGSLACRWISAHYNAWVTWLPEAVCSGQFAHTSYVSERTTHKPNATSDPQRCLDNTSVSTPGLLLLMLRFSMSPREMDGLGLGKPRVADRLFLEALLAILAHLDTLKLIFDVNVRQTWTRRWLRPLPRAQHSTQFRLEVRGDMMDVGEFTASLTRLGSTFVGECLKELLRLLRVVDGSVAVAKFLR